MILFVACFVGLGCLLLWIYCAIDILASAMTKCDGGNRRDWLWRISWDHRRIMWPIGFAMCLIPLAAFLTFIISETINVPHV